MQIKSTLRAVAVVLPVAALLVSAVPVPKVDAAGSCSNYNIAVALTSGGPKTYKVSATLCKPAAATTKVDVMLHGGTYNRTYWDANVQGAANAYPFYSYAARTVASGRAALYFDLIGAGKSTKPLSTDLTIDNVAYTVHQVVQWAKSSKGFSDVTLIGHSMGSFTAMRVASAWPTDAKRVVVTGALHLPGEVQNLNNAVGQNMYPANNEAKWVNLDSGYLTTKPNVRKSIFYYGATAEDAVVRYDEANKDVVSLNFASGALIDMTVPPADNVSSKITAHVYVILGAQDNWMCKGSFVCTEYNVKVNEAPYFKSAKSIGVKVVPYTGHDLTLQTTATTSFNAINTWIKSR